MEIPPGSSVPVARPLKLTCSSTHIYFDIETTSLDRTSHIIQFSARRGNEDFNFYVKPTKPISSKASEITGITMCNGNMYQHNQLVECVTIHTAHEKFITFLSSTPNNILIGHNVQTFDCPVLFNSLHACKKIESFMLHCTGFIDTRKAFSKAYPDLSSYRQQDLFTEFLGDSYKAHDSLEDVTALQRLCDKVRFSTVQMELASFGIEYAEQMQKYLSAVCKNLPSLGKLVTDKALSLGMAKKIAGSGLTLQHLKIVYKHGGLTGIKNIFSEKVGESVRVTKSQRISASVANYLENLNLEQGSELSVSWQPVH